MIEQIKTNLDWLDRNSKSPNISEISIVINKIAIQAQNLIDMRSDAYDIMNEYEDDYKIAVAQFCKDGVGGVAKLANDAIVEHADLKKKATKAKNDYQRLKGFIDGLDKILECQRQRISIEKQMGLKNM